MTLDIFITEDETNDTCEICEHYYGNQERCSRCTSSFNEWELAKELKPIRGNTKKNWFLR